MNPDLNIELPVYNSIWTPTSDDSIVELPKVESDFIIGLKDANSFSNNIFGLIDNNVLEVYKFCQCKNNIHEIISSMNTNEYSFKVDCNHKRVYSISDHQNHKEEVISDERYKLNEIQVEKKKKNPWLFKINSSSSYLINELKLIKTFFIIYILFRLFFY
jgi:hypothetical protein